MSKKRRTQTIKVFGISGIVTTLALLAVLIWLGPGAALITLILIAIEVAFSFDNAIINAKILRQLSHSWQRIFLTVGLIFAVLGMRLLFPIILVALSAHISIPDVWNLAIKNPTMYANEVKAARPTISAFGGSFLLMLALYFFLFDNHEVLWIERVEWRLKKLGNIWLPALISSSVVLILSLIAFNTGRNGHSVLVAGVLGILTYLVIHRISAMLSNHHNKRKNKASVAGTAALGLFMYLEIMDASFSFDGVLGAFAITTKILLIAIGLGVGALWVRSMTISIVRSKLLDEYIYLDHGAHYTIAVIAAVLLLSIFFTVPSLLVGIVGIGIIYSSLIASKQALVDEDDYEE